MKRYGLMMLCFAVILAAVPAVPAIIERRDSTDSEKISEESVHDDKGETILMLDTSTGDVLSLSMRDYIIGAVTAEMPASFEEEALKAQAVAVHTYAVRRQEAERENPTPDLCGADISNDSGRYQAYFTKSQAMEFYGTGFEAAYEKISAAADEVLPYILTYEDEPILAAFCSMSSGQTESAENVWGQEVPYLVSADSEADKKAPNYRYEEQITKGELKEILENAYPEGDFSGDCEKWLETGEKSESGTVLEAMAGGVRTTGQEIRAALGLRSAAFEVKWENGNCTITTRGYGHGVGMSQYGANAMAKSGSDWREILGHYYSGAKIAATEKTAEKTNPKN